MPDQSHSSEATREGDLGAVRARPLPFPVMRWLGSSHGSELTQIPLPGGSRASR